MRGALLVFFVFATSGCTSPALKNTEPRQHEIRVFSLNAVFNYVSSRDREYSELIQKKTVIEKKLKELQDKGAPSSEILVYREGLETIASAEEKHKGRIYSLIKTAVREYSSRNSIDFVFNIADGGIYADRKYDITEEIVLEVKRIEKRSDPAAR